MNQKHEVVSGITVEWDDAKHGKVNVKDGPRDKTKIPRSDKGDDEFTPSRIIVDLKLDLGDITVKQVTLNDVHVKVTYDNAEKVKPTIGWWNGAKWVKFKSVVHAGNVVDVTLPSPWPTDPAVGIYP